MKIKSLLVAGMAVAAMSATAQDPIPVQSYLTIDFKTAFENVEVGGLTDFIDVTLTRVDEAEDFTNMQFYLETPDGIEGAVIKASPATMAVDPILEENFQALTWSWNQLPNEFRTAGANLTKTALTVGNDGTPFLLCQMKMKKTAELAPNTTIRVFDLKYTDYADNLYVAVEDPEKFVFQVTGPSEDVAVENVNAGKAVAGVKYYNVAGVAADEAFEGVNIVVTTYADGTQNVVKVVK